MSSSELAISVRGLGKAYTILHNDPRHSTLAEMVLERLRSPLKRAERETFWALRDVTFDVRRGEVLGIIGRNGAGKSTLLKVLSRITEPTTGEIDLYGRTGSLLEVGTGFHPELTGRENIYLNGSILGMSRAQIERQFDAIVEFAGTEKFLDTPVKRYSSGMYVRLAFAVAAHLDTEVLIVDEVLAVGDAEFQKKCLGKMGEVASAGRTVLFVSHNMAMLESLCDGGMLLDAGRVVRCGPMSELVADYHRGVLAGGEDSGDSVIDLRDRSSFFRSVQLLDEVGNPTRYIPMGTEFRLRAVVESAEPIDYPTFTVMIDNALGQRMMGTSSPNTEAAISRFEGRCALECRIPAFPLAPGEYWVRLGLWWKGEWLETVDHALYFTVSNADTFGDGWGAHVGVCVAPSAWSIEPSLEPITIT